MIDRRDRGGFGGRERGIEVGEGGGSKDVACK